MPESVLSSPSIVAWHSVTRLSASAGHSATVKSRTEIWNKHCTNIISLARVFCVCVCEIGNIYITQFYRYLGKWQSFQSRNLKEAAHQISKVPGWWWKGNSPSEEANRRAQKEERMMTQRRGRPAIGLESNDVVASGLCTTENETGNQNILLPVSYCCS